MTSPASTQKAYLITLTFCAALYLLAWCWHLYINTAALRGFWGDGSIEFLIHLSHTPLMGGTSSWVHLFPVGMPRDGSLFLNAIGLQLALWAHIQDPQTYKYIYVFWQYALPGFLYLALFYFLYRNRLLAWAVFPLLSWAICSVAVDWSAVNNTRWAVPIFWMHFFVVITANRNSGIKSFLALAALSLLLLAGLYESVVAQTGLLLGLGAYFWIYKNNNRPFFYALAAIPASIRALYDYITVGQYEPNSFHGFALQQLYAHPYGQVIMLGLLFPLALIATPKSARVFPLGIFLLTFIYLAVQLLLNPALSPWIQSALRFDYIALSFALMGIAGVCFYRNQPPTDWGAPTAIAALLIGSLFWFFQTLQTDIWQSCTQEYHHIRGNKPLTTTTGLSHFLTPNDKTTILSPRQNLWCIWDWTMPWFDLLTAPQGRVTQWPLFTFWQDFAFIEKNNAVYLHTNNWTMTSPSVIETSVDLPLQTPLYDLTPLYHATGLGDLYSRDHCIQPKNTPDHWPKHLATLDNAHRQKMHVCPAQE